MKLSIHNNKDLLERMKSSGLPLAARVKKLLVKLLEDQYGKSPDVTICIHTSLIPASYSTVPAMLARVLAPDCPFLHISCKLEGEYMIISAGDEKKPTTFRARLIEGLRKNKRFVCKRTRIPKTYRARPKLLSNAIAGELEGRIATIAKPKRVIWKLTTRTT